MLREGDMARGKEIFFQWQSTSCSHCHTTDGKGGKVGPDLFAIGDKFGRREIMESVLAPSATIAVGYSATTIETKAGEEYVGVLKQVTEEWIELLGVDARPMRIATATLQRQHTSEVSLMPEGLHSALTLQEFTDLVEFLVSLKQPESATLVRHGMPSVIEPLARPVALRPIIPEALKFEHPVWFGPIPGESNVFLVVEHETGKVWRLEIGFASLHRHPGIETDRNTSGTPLTRPSDTLSPRRGEGWGEGSSKTLFADFGAYQKGTRGLLGIALHPKFRENRKYYYAKHLVENGRFATLHFACEARLDLKADSGKPPRLLLKLDAATNVHYGGGLEFGPEGYLYIGMGDTGPQEDPQGHGQNTKLLLGKLLRIDVDHAADQPYSIPPDNPFVGRADFRPEIWAYGFREPWRFSFDPLTKDLWVGDVGQDRYEEVCIVQRGENHGWNVYEGFERFSNRYRREGETFVPPVFAYPRKYGPSVTGGYVYRANPRSSFYGVYVFGDYESRRIFALTQTNRVLKTIRQIGAAPQRIVSFGRDAQGELYVVGYEGMIYRMDLNEAFGQAKEN